MSVPDPCITYSCSHDLTAHDLDFVQEGTEWVEVTVEPESGKYCRTCWETEGIECRFSSEPSEAQLESMYRMDGPSARSEYIAAWEQHQVLHG